MNIPILTFFNNKGGVGKTSLVYHIAHLLADLGVRVLAADLDPQCNLTAAFLDESEIEDLWPETSASSTTAYNYRTIYGVIGPLKSGTGDVAIPELKSINEHLALIPGDIALSGFEDDLSQAWPTCLGGDVRSFRVLSAFWRVLQLGVQKHQSHVVILDIGPNLGAINRAALIASSHVIVPLVPDLFSLQGLKNLGPALRQWRHGWKERLPRNPDKELKLPEGSMEPIGYIVMQHSVRLDRPVKSYEKWSNRIPSTYERYILDERKDNEPLITQDPHCLAMVKHYRSLMPMAQEARKPIFYLTPADGALGSHFQAALAARNDFETLARKIASTIQISIP